MMTFQLAGQVVSLQPVKLAGFSRDTLLLSFQQAKVSIFNHQGLAENHAFPNHGILVNSVLIEHHGILIKQC